MEVRLGPRTRTIAADDEILVTAPDGTIGPDEKQGYFCADTRLVSRFHLTLGGAAPVLLDSAVVEPFTVRFEYTNPRLHLPGGTVAARQLHLRDHRTIGRGIRQDLDLTNFAPSPVSVEVVLHIEGDFRDLFDVKAGDHEPVPQPATWSQPADGVLRLLYRVAGFRRGVDLVPSAPPPGATMLDGRIVFVVDLPRRGHWHASLDWRPIVDIAASAEPEPPRRRLRRWLDETAAGISTGNPDVDAVLERASEDLGALRLYRPLHDASPDDASSDDDASPDDASSDDDASPDDDGRGRWLVAAGIPWFVAPFGRDALVTALQTLPLSPELAAGAVRVLAGLQADHDDPLHDAEPGKIAHELRHGEKAHFHRIPQTPYYGAHDAPALFVLATAAAWRWRGDRSELDALRPHAERALEWIDSLGDRDGDGFQEYAPRSGQWGYYNQSWKDASDALVDHEGRLVGHPIATCELQGYTVAAKRAWADVVEQAFGDDRCARGLRDAADRLADMIDTRFWWEAEETYYFALDGDKRPVETVVSNPGHLLWSRAVPPERAVRLADRLLADDLWSGWGIRTLSASHPSFNPFSYQRGSVWPHDNALIVEGLVHYGLVEHAATVSRGVLDAAARFQHRRLPELFAGLARDPDGFPVQYPDANVPQAWAAGAAVLLVTAFAGLQPDASAGRLRVAPCLPPHFDRLAFRGLRVGDATVDLVISRDGVVATPRRGHLTLER